MPTYTFITDSDYSCRDMSFQYLLWFQPSLGWIIFNEEKFYVILDGRYFEKTKTIDKEKIKKILKNEKLKIEFVESKNPLDSIADILQNEENIFIEGKVAWEYIEKIENKIGKKLNILTWWYFTNHRLYKTQEEKESIKKAISIIDTVFLYIEELNQKWQLIGKTELEIRWIIISKIFEFGGEGESFESIVAFGENSAIPHHKTWNTKILNGVLVIDMWALYNSYCSDFTRTFWVGEKNTQYDKFVKIYDIVKNAHNNAYQNAKAGISWKEIDAFTRNYIETAGYGKNYIHGTGHGLGLDIHEKPRINASSNEIIENNMVFTIEPWIYLPWEFGIRLEDIVFMENWKLNKYTKVKI